jgi:hypothetical protein
LVVGELVELATVVVGGIVVGVELIIVALWEAKGKLKDVLGVARLQNCCARPSAEASSVGHIDDIQATISVVKFLL